LNWVAETQYRFPANNEPVIGEVSALHDVPALVVLRIVPPKPTAVPKVAFVKATPLNVDVTLPTPLVSSVQVAPALIDLYMLGGAPTANAVFASAKATE
jgi:hypothetical protein